MDKKKIYLGNNELVTDKSNVVGQFVDIDGERYYQIQNYHEMPDFFMSIVSDSNHWMYISSNGSLSAGRKNRDNALFPYYTVDKIHDYKGTTGSRTAILVKKENKIVLWQPFTEESRKYYNIERHLFKNTVGNKVIFEEINSDLNLSFRYSWNNSEKFGFVKKSEVTALGDSDIELKILDGIQNIMPYGVGYGFQNEYSNLLDAYKKSERIENSSIGLFMLSSIPIDRAEPSEALKTTTVWSTGLDKGFQILLSNDQVVDFCNGCKVQTEHDVKATRGAYFVVSEFILKGNSTKSWITVAEINQGSAAVSNLNHLIKNTKDIYGLIVNDVDLGTMNLQRMVSSADGLQLTNTELCYVRHYSNTLYNIMRGGVYKNNYVIETDDYKRYVWEINKLVSKEHQLWLDSLPDNIEYRELLKLSTETNDSDLLRITYEYLPLTFSRRHGDPSRPWNVFSIDTKDDDGNPIYQYQGNWRDIFQNWEALSFSYPDFVEGIICKFVNASTIDGYNPYRIMRDGFDWEVIDSNDPWSYIGYWSDHQIIYLQKLLEISDNFHPGTIDELLDREIFTYANVPYRIKSYSEILFNPKDTVVFDYELHKRINSEVEYLGADARLLKSKSQNRVYKVNFTEKFLTTLLSKLCNFVPEAGIWLNTQRPEWNDANNALAGYGTSMVTLYYIRRFLKFWEKKFENTSLNEIKISEELATLFESVYKIYTDNSYLLKQGFSDKERKDFTDNIGEAHWKYRNEIYCYSFSGEKTKIEIQELIAFIRISIRYIDQSIQVNKREDGLYHAYNLISIVDNNITIRNLYEMLEGQVAVLTSGFLTTKESLEVLNSLKVSDMFREDQYSYMLYPDRQLPRFTEKNIIPGNLVKKSKLLSQLIEDGEQSIVKVDNEGVCHFNGTFRNADSLKESLDNLRSGGYSQLVEKERQIILDVYEEIFDHQSFTGRSGTFYGYEGLGSIYWHMVSKLLLATQECFFRAVTEGASEEIIGKLKNHYYEIKAGIGLYKSPELYGAFPTDAYSHTPANAGVKQPGLTGQVKEDVISRIGEMGIQVINGEINFNTALINEEEILTENIDFQYFNLKGESKNIKILPNQMVITFCQIPIVYSDAEDDRIEVIYENEKVDNINGLIISKEISMLVFGRHGSIERINVMKKELK